VLSHPSSLSGHSDFPNAHDRLLSVSPDLQTADRRRSVVKNSTTLRKRRDLRYDLSLTFLACHWPYSGSCAGARPLCFPAHIGLPPRRTGSASIPPRGFVPQPDSPGNTCPATTHGAAPFVLYYGLRFWQASLTGLNPEAMTVQSRRDAVSGHVQPIRYRTNPPSASVPERGIGTTATFTLQVREFHTSYTPALCRRFRAVCGRIKPDLPHNLYGGQLC
jgi:hypothetical protein